MARASACQHGISRAKLFFDSIVIDPAPAAQDAIHVRAGVPRLNSSRNERLTLRARDASPRGVATIWSKALMVLVLPVTAELAQPVLRQHPILYHKAMI